jgi:hypothetical protein
VTWTPIQPYTDPALEHLAQFIADRLNQLQSDMVRRWIVSEMLSYSVEEYPLLQLHCLAANGEALEHCQGSIRYVLINDQIQVGEQQQLGFRWVQRAIAKILRQFIEQTAFLESPIHIAPQKFRSEIRSGALKLADGSTATALTWVEIFFEYGDCADLGRSGH